ncbi:putative membrane protein YhhN [Agromyces cerinus]|uniref:lysoplasmalogenase n=1 Tax=Agromyces cerinus TaxID=33878 RepID=UPI0019582416|nr:lysoplasmalogenase [Agromyces cerinus]MBM7831024.1 putative membrane protein YhhN [Agromyces cerinus]
MNRFRSPLIAFAPYLVVSALHLVLLYLGPAWSVTATKALLMPLLALAVVLLVRPLRAPVPLLLTGIAFSWGGDVLLSFPGDGWFAAGLCSFLLAHVAYIVLFLRMPRARPRPPAWSYVYWAWMIVVLGLLLPHAGVLAAPIVLYAAAIGAMAMCASMHGRWIVLGGACFIVSDSVLALGRFLPGYEFAAHDFVVMSTYLAAQGLIAWGVVAATLSRRAAAGPSSPAPDRRADATAP